MRAYFDTNVYSYVCSTAEVRAVRAMLRQRRIRVVASDENLFEMFAIPRSTARQVEIDALFAISTDRPRAPGALLDADELRRAIMRHRPAWLRPIPHLRKAKTFLRGHQQRWADARRGILPPSSAYQVFRDVVETGTALSNAAQKQYRKLRLQRDMQLVLTNWEEYSAEVNLEDPECYWRVDGFFAWRSALVDKVEASRDYRDWLGPYLNPGAFEGADYAEFWLKDLESQEVPRIRAMGLTSFFQAEHKITHGNAADLLHATHLLDVDLFFTCDRAFFATLEQVRTRLTRSASIVLLRRAASSALDEIVGALDQPDEHTSQQ